MTLRSDGFAESFEAWALSWRMRWGVAAEPSARTSLIQASICPKDASCATHRCSCDTSPRKLATPAPTIARAAAVHETRLVLTAAINRACGSVAWVVARRPPDAPPDPVDATSGPQPKAVSQHAMVRQASSPLCSRVSTAVRAASLSAGTIVRSKA